MSYHEFKVAAELAKEDHPFYSLIMAAMWKSDDINKVKLKSLYPGVWEEAQKRYNAPGGFLEGEDHG